MKTNILGVGLDTTKLSFSPEFGEFNYVYTDLSAGNDYLISEYIRNKCKKSSLIVSTGFLDGAEKVLFGHMDELGRERVDLLMISPKSMIDKYQTTLVSLIDTGIVLRLGISFPSSLEELKSAREFLNYLGLSADNVSLNINPLQYDPEIIKYCEESDIAILGFNQFGGHLSAATLIDEYSVPYLLEFSATKSDLVMLSSRDMYSSVVDQSYLRSLIGSESRINEWPKEKIDNAQKSVQKRVWGGLIFDDGSLLPHHNTDLTYDPGSQVFSYGKSILPGIIENSEKTALEKTIYDLYGNFHKPEDGGESEFFSLLRFHVLRQIRLQYPGRSISSVNIGDRIIVISATKRTWTSGGWFKKDKIVEDINTWILYYQDNTFLFKELKMDLESDRNLNNDKN